MTNPTRTLQAFPFRLAIVLSTLVTAGSTLLGYATEAAPAKATPPAEWYLEHNDFMARDGGVFHTDNSAYKSETEPWDAYGMAWEKGPTGQTVRGRLFGIKDGKNSGPFWEFYAFWHPAEGRAYMQQVGRDGTLGVGAFDPPSPDGSQRLEQTFHYMDGSTVRVGHISRNTVEKGVETHHTRSLNWADGKWQPRRSYIWTRVVAESENPRPSPSDSDGS